MALVEEAVPFGVVEGLEIPGLARNSMISVTIDDLAEGLLVVSFAHSDNLYQGVLFQLNRERGIPSGISFAKEQALGSGSTPDKVEGDILVAQPLHKRHSYNPGSSCSTSPSSRMQSSLRRIIKRPDRFKNSAMSLRLRARPVLCAKCRSLCDDKPDSNDPPKEGNQTEKSKGKGRPPKQGAFPAMNGKLTGAQQQSGTSEVAADTDPQDLTYESVGSTGVIANYWKRPLVQPIIPSSEETYSRLRKHKVNLDPGAHPRNKRKRTTTTMACISNRGTGNQSARTGATMNKSSNKSDVQHGKEEEGSKNMEEALSEPFPPSDAQNNLFMCRSTSCDNDVPITRRRKELSLKMCITKITDLRNGDCTVVAAENSSTAEKQDVVDDTFHLLSRNGSGPGETSNEYITGNEKMRTQKKKPGRPSKKANKEWGNRMRATSNVPVRYRDEGSLPNNVFNFKRRSPDVDETPLVLTISRDDDVGNAFKVSNLTEGTNNCHAEDKEHDERSQTPPQPSSSSVSAEEFDEKSRDNSESSMIRTPQSLGSSSSHEGTVRSKSTVSKPPEIMKTPTIKITFGSLGNGMVVQIPPKLAQNAELEPADAKAAKRALKKARKEAKRRRSVSPLHSPSFDAFSPDNSLKSERSQPSFPIVPPHQDQELHNANNPFFAESSPPSPSLLEPPAQPSPSSELITKKKKQKKRRRSSKNLKENDDCGGSNNWHELSGSMSSSVSSSTHIQDCASHEHGPTSPPTMTAKSVAFESISNPGTPEPLLSFTKDSPPPRRRSVPVSSSTSSDTPRRVCINLKRVDTNAYVPLPKLQSISCQGEEDEEEESSVTENNGAETDDCDSSEVSLIGSSNGSEMEVGALTSESVDYYKDKGTECIYRKGDIVWGKLPAWPWWPGKISDIVQYSSDDARANISWFKSNTQSSVGFEMLVPFTQYYDCKYEKHRKRGAYQAAVSAAMSELESVRSPRSNRITLQIDVTP